MTTSAPILTETTWHGLMAGLVGLRLAIYDELLTEGALDAAECARRLAGDGARGAALTQELPQAVAWLVRHRLLVAHEGQWRAVLLGLANMNFESNGPESIAQATATRPTPPPAVRGDTPAVHRHQVEFFTMAGYQDSNGTTN